MDSRLETFQFGSGIVCLCFVGISFHLKGEERQKLKSSFKNYSEIFNKTYSGDAVSETTLSNFQKSLHMIEMLNKKQEDETKLSMTPNLKSAGGVGDDEILKKHIESINLSRGYQKTLLLFFGTNKLVEEEDYRLTLKDGTCSLRSPPTGITVRSNFTCDSFEGSEEQLLRVLANHGPVAAAVDATNWQYYLGGIIQWHCEANVNHAVQIVGYDKTATPPHYIVRNSRGTEFGDNGYLYVAIGSHLCGIAREVSSLSVM